MAKTLWKSGYKDKRHWRIVWSEDWASMNPWTGSSYFEKDICYSDSGATRLDIWYLGPLAVVRGSLIF